MAVPQYIGHTGCDRSHNIRSCSLRVQYFHGVRAGITFQEAEGHQDRFSREFRLTVCRDPFFEYTNDSESQLTDSNLLSDWIRVWKNNASEVLAEKANFAARRVVRGIKITAARDE